MNWIVFAVLSWILFGLELGLRDALALGQTGVAPSFIIPFAVIVTLASPTTSGSWACFLLGLIIDLTFPIETREGGPPRELIGPHAAGFLIACQLVAALRAVVMRRNPLAIGFLAVLFAAVSHVVVVAMITARSALGDPLVWNASGELIARLGASLYTGAVGVILAFAFIPLGPMLGLATAPARRFARRGADR